MQKYGDNSMSVMDVFYNTKVDIFYEENGMANDLGIVTTMLSPFVENLKAVKNPLTVQQSQQRYGLDILTEDPEYRVRRLANKLL